MQFMEKLWKMWENMEIIKLQQRKKKKLLGGRSKLYYKVFHRKCVSYRNEGKQNKKQNKNKNGDTLLGLSTLELSKILMYEF